MHKVHNKQKNNKCDENSVNFSIELGAEISIWMQSRFDGFDFCDTLAIYLKLL